MAVGQERLNTLSSWPNPAATLPLPTLTYNRPPTNMDYGIPGQQWLDTSVIPSVMYYMSNNAAGLYNWIILETAGGAGVFSSLTVTPGPISLNGTTTINTSGTATTTIGTVNGASGISLHVGTSNFSLTGAATSNITIGGSITGGNINLGNALTTGTITIGSSLSTGALNLGNSTGSSLTSIYGGPAVAGGIFLGAGGFVKVTPATTSVASPANGATINSRLCQATFTGFTTAAAATQVFVLTNSQILATSTVIVDIVNLNASGNFAAMAITGKYMVAGTLTIETVNNGVGALGAGDNVLITAWIFN